MQTIDSCTQAVCRYAFSVMLAIASIPAAAHADIPRVSKKSTLYPLIEEYFPDYAGNSRDPLHTPELKKQADHAVELGWKYFDRGDHNTALKRFLVALRLDDENATAYFGVAYVCSVDNNIDEAILFYREALKYQTHYAPIYANLGRALLMKDPKSTEAAKLLQQAIAVDPNYPESFITYARYLSDQGEWKRSAEQLQKAISLGRKIEPEVVDSYRKQGIILKQ